MNPIRWEQLPSEGGAEGILYRAAVPGGGWLYIVAEYVPDGERDGYRQTRLETKAMAFVPE